MKKTEDRDGYTIIEVMIAMAIFAIGILALYAMQISAVDSNATARKRSLALAWAQDRIEKLMETPFADATLTAGTYIVPSDADGIDNNNDGFVDEIGETGNYSISWNVADIDLNGDGVNDAKSIQVQVNWDELGGSRNTYLSALKTDI